MYNNKEQIFCEWRHRWVRLTPEEWVRQQLLHRLVEQLGYRQMAPLMLIECKAETVPLTQKTLDQALTYNRLLNVPYLLLNNGPQTIFVTLLSNGTNTISQRCAGYADLLRRE